MFWKPACNRGMLGTILGLCPAPAGGTITLRGYGFNLSSSAVDLVGVPFATT